MQEENLEMQNNGDASAAAAAASYGTDQGYSEDYGAPASMKAATTLNNDNYGAVYQATSDAGNQPVNPFTQQQYQEKPSTNPFAK